MFRKIVELLFGKRPEEPSGDGRDARADFFARADGVATVQPPPAEPVTVRPEVMTGAFEPGFIGEADEKRYPLRSLRIGEVNLASGRLVLADPFIVWGEAAPLDLELTPGRYPVDIAVADAGESGHRVALARLMLSEETPVRWALAVTAEQDPGRLKTGEIFGYGVDAGTGAFMDAGMVAWMETLSPDEGEALTDGWQTRGEALGPALGIPYGFVLVEEGGPGGAAMFSSGWGDGFYASWVGYDAEDRPAQVVTDFAVITAVDIPQAR